MYVCVLSSSVMSDSCDPMDCSLPSSSVYGILQARVLECVAISSSRGSSQTRDQTHVSCISRWVLYLWVTWEALYMDEYTCAYTCICVYVVCAYICIELYVCACYACFCIYICVCVYIYIYSHTIHMYRYSIFLLLPSFLVMENIGVHAFFPLCLFTKSMITLCFSYFLIWKYSLNIRMYLIDPSMIQVSFK